MAISFSVDFLWRSGGISPPQGVRLFSSVLTPCDFTYIGQMWCSPKNVQKAAVTLDMNSRKDKIIYNNLIILILRNCHHQFNLPPTLLWPTAHLGREVAWPECCDIDDTEKDSFISYSVCNFCWIDERSASRSARRARAMLRCTVTSGHIPRYLFLSIPFRLYSIYSIYK